jgi:DNA-binding SARP family transcriptional activator
MAASRVTTKDDEVVSAPATEAVAHPSGLAIIASKISPAAPARSVLTRPRLVEWFGRQSSARLILVSGEAGYGKSTLLNEFALQTSDRCAWYRMESSDGDWITFLSHMVASLRELDAGFGAATEALLRNVAAMGPSREVVLGQFLADLNLIAKTRIAVILDDYHFVEESQDVRMILSRMLERAPEGMYFILGGRGRPNLALGRLVAQGRVSELTIDDLRFTRTEIDDLFTVTYGQPLDEAACSVVVDRTEGWAASLRLVAASIAVTQPNQVANFIDALSGASAPIYDFLAEEVLARMSPSTQRVLMHAALIDRVRPELVSAALSVTDYADEAATVGFALDDAEALGLLGSRSRSSSNGRRIHPLFRDFLQAYLGREVSSAQVRAMHCAIAKAAEPSDRLVAAKHFALADMPEDGLRVLGSAAGETLGTGAWGAAVEIVDLMPDTPPPVAVKVIKARALISDGYPDDALVLLSGIDCDILTPEERGLVGLTRAAIHHMNGDGRRVVEEIEEVAADPDVPSPLHEVALTWRQILIASAGGCISDAVQMLRRLAVSQRHAGLHYFAGVTLHNTANAELARGNYQQACDLAGQALAQLDETDDGAGISASTRSVAAAARAELGDIEEGLRAAAAAAAEPSATADAIAEAAYMHAVCGRVPRARALLEAFDRGNAPWASDLPSRALANHARAAMHLACGQVTDASTLLGSLRDFDGHDVDSKSRYAIVAATVAVVTQTQTAPEVVRRALETASSQNAWRWMARARILEAVVGRNGDDLALLIAEAEQDSSLAVLELADVIAAVIGSLNPLPEALERSILREPSRWMAALRRQVQDVRSEDASAAASLIARFGTAQDAPVLREYDRISDAKGRRRGLATQLIRRVSPTVRVHDLGLTSLEVGNRLVTLTETRRKPAALLLYLVTRPDLVANREQVMDSLWPDQNPKSAMNSLHQTLFFLRRELEPWYEDGSTADYVRVESDLVYLDRELFQIDSVAFARQVSDILGTGTVLARGPEMLRLYKGGFAPEFEYEEWTEEWRTHLHGSFLRLAHATAQALIREGRFSDVVELLAPVITVDPTAFDLRMTLVACLAAIGAADAAHAQYRSMATAYERDLGLPAPRFEDVVKGLRP